MHTPRTYTSEEEASRKGALEKTFLKKKHNIENAVS